MKFEAEVTEVLQETPEVKLVRLTWDGINHFGFRPGQWVGVWCDEFIGENNKPLRRAFSIASHPGEDHIELCIARGRALSAHLQDVKPKGKVHVDGPYGLFWLKPAEKYLFIAGGTGIAPFRPMIKEALDDGKEVLLLYSMKTPSDFIYRDELEAWKENKNFTLITTLTVDGFPEWKGERGRIQTFLEKYFKPGYGAYLCGTPTMIEELEERLLKLGQPKDKIWVDKWE